MDKFIVKFFGVFIFVFFSCSAKSVIVFAKMKPAGDLEIRSSKLLGHVTYRADQKKYYSDYLFVPVESLESNISLRDMHINNFLNSKKFKNIVMKNIVIFQGKGTGDLSINGVNKEVSFKVVDSEGFMVAVFVINMSDFSLSPPSFMGVTLENEIIITAKFNKKLIELISP